MIFSSVFDLVGHTPLLRFRLPHPGVRLHVKLESMNPTGSIKDRACVYNIRDAEARGDLKKGKVLLDASSGNMACAMAYFGKLLGYPVEVVCNSKLTDDKRNFIKFFGAELRVVGDRTIEGNAWCREIVSTGEGHARYCFLDQLHNPANPLASYETLGPEITADLPNVRAVIGSMGSGGSMCGVARCLADRASDALIITTEAASGTKLPGTGAFVDGEYVTPFVAELQERRNDTFLVSQADAEKRTIELACQGIYAGFQAGAVLEAACRAIDKHRLVGDIVMIIGDAGWKNADKLKSLT